MRISQQQAQIIADKVAEVLPNTKYVLLFGSRVDDHLKGGGLDIYVEVNENVENPAEANARITAKL